MDVNWTIGKRATLEVPAVRAGRLSRWLAWGLAFGVSLALLAYAETVWLHQGLPQDRVTRVALVAFPATRGEGASGAPQTAPSDEWSRSLMQQALDAELLRGLIAQLDLLDGATGERLSPQQLAASMNLGSQCIEQKTSDGGTVRGVLLFNVVRGSDPAQVDAIAREWSRALIERSASELPGLAIQPVESLAVPYEGCR